MGVQNFHINEVRKKIFKGEGSHDGQFPYLKRFLGKVPDTPMHTIMLVMLRTSCKTKNMFTYMLIDIKS